MGKQILEGTRTTENGGLETNLSFEGGITAHNIKRYTQIKIISGRTLGARKTPFQTTAYGITLEPKQEGVPADLVMEIIYRSKADSEGTMINTHWQAADGYRRNYFHQEPVQPRVREAYA